MLDDVAIDVRAGETLGIVGEPGCGSMTALAIMRLVPSGDPPSPIDLPPGCAFSGRCPIAVQRCHRESPPLRQLTSQRRVACHLVDLQEPQFLAVS